MTKTSNRLFVLTIVTLVKVLFMIVCMVSVVKRPLHSCHMLQNDNRNGSGTLECVNDLRNHLKKANSSILIWIINPCEIRK